MKELKSLQETGFAVVENFLNQDEVSQILSAYQNDYSSEGQFPIWSNLKNESIRPFEKKCKNLAGEIAKETDIFCDIFSGLTYFTMEGNVNYWGTGTWHQDVVGYYASPNVYNYLNFYLPILKPDKSKSNLSVIPFDKLKAMNPKAAESLIGRGLANYNFNGSICFTAEENDKVVATIPDLDSIAATPHLAAGDLLILRGDLIHRTQDATTKRIAISYRMRDSRQVVSKSKLLNAGLEKMLFMVKSAGIFAELFDALRYEKSDQLTFGQIHESIKNNVDNENYREKVDMLDLLLGYMDSAQRKRLVDTIKKKQKWSMLDSNSNNICDYILAHNT